MKIQEVEKEEGERMRRLISVCIFLISCTIFSANGQSTQATHEDEITAIEYSGNGNYIITGGRDRKIRLWNAYNGEMIYSQECEFVPAAFYISPDNHYLILSNNAGKNQLFDFLRGEKIKDLMVEEVRGFSRDSKSILTVTYAHDGRERYAALGYADLHDEYFIKYFSQNRIYINSSVKQPVLSEKGKTILLPNDSEEIYKFDNEDVSAEQIITLERPVSVAAFYPGDSAIIINGSANLYTFEVDSSFSFFEEATLPDPNSKIIVSNNFIVNSTSNEVKIFDTKSGEVITHKNFPEASLLAADPTGIEVALTTDKLTVEVQNLHSGKSFYLAAPDIIEKIAYQNYLKAIYFLNLGKQLKARDYLDAAENKSPRALKLYFLRGESNLQMGFYKKAIADFLIDHVHNPGRSALKIAQAFAALNEIETALKWIDSSFHYGYPVSIIQLKDNSDFGQALKSKIFYEKIHSYLDPDAEKLVRLSQGKVKTGEILAALEYINKALEIEKKDYQILRERAKIYLQLNEYEKARKDYQAIAKLNKNMEGEAFLNVALTYSKTGDLTNTIVWIKKAIHSDAYFTGSMIDIAELYENAYRRDLAILTLNEYLKLVPIDHYAVYLRASLLPIPETAREEITKAINLCNEQGFHVPKEYYDFQNSLTGSARN